jgi:hypothetical protein
MPHSKGSPIPNSLSPPPPTQIKNTISKNQYESPKRENTAKIEFYVFIGINSQIAQETQGYTPKGHPISFSTTE